MAASNACLTDMIRSGRCSLRDGAALTGEQVVPEAWIADTLDGGPDSRQAFAASPTTPNAWRHVPQPSVFPYPAATSCCARACVVR